jgi:hypothetical protein
VSGRLADKVLTLKDTFWAESNQPLLPVWNCPLLLPSTLLVSIVEVEKAPRPLLQSATKRAASMRTFREDSKKPGMLDGLAGTSRDFSVGIG